MDYIKADKPANNINLIEDFIFPTAIYRLTAEDVAKTVDRSAIVDFTVRCLQKTVLVGASVNGQGIYETDVRPLRSFNRTHASIVSRVHITHFETCPIAG